MDLAKIRNKFLQTLGESVDERVIAPALSSGLKKNTLDAITAAPASAEVDFLPQEPCYMPVASVSSAPPLIAAVLQDHASAVRTPLEAILAGRSAAGCDDESLLAEDATDQTVAESSLEFLCFRVSNEIYGINIMDIKEIIKPREVTEVPRAPAFVSGILSLRGTIIPIIDMRLRLGLAQEEPTGKERIIVIKNDNSFSGLLVDEVIQVVQVQPDSVEAAPAVLDGTDRDFISGIGHSDGRLMIILNLENISDIHLY